jgi:NAD(P)H-hydrate repair Nnr-like enzyme with NAD(P)H-hydrate epimerase domain
VLLDGGGHVEEIVEAELAHFELSFLLFLGGGGGDGGVVARHDVLHEADQGHVDG